MDRNVKTVYAQVMTRGRWGKVHIVDRTLLSRCGKSLWNTLGEIRISKRKKKENICKACKEIEEGTWEFREKRDDGQEKS